MTVINVKKIIRRKSLGRAAYIGSLYNAVSDTFCGTTLFKSEIPNDSINKVEILNSELLYEYDDSYKEKFDKLDVETELKLSILAGLLTLEGLGKYLSDIKESFRSVKGNLIYRMTSVEENLDICRDDVKACISTDVFNNSDATHVVIGIKWGSTMIASFECKNMKDKSKSQVEKALKSHFEKLLPPISENGDMDVGEDQSDLMSYFSIKLLGDAVPHNKKLPQSFDEARKVMSQLPSHTKQFNGGKGFPIEYVLYPLSELAKILTQNVTVDNMTMELSKEIAFRIEQVFDGLLEPKQRLNDLFNDANSISDLILDEIFNEIDDHVQVVKLDEAKFRKKFSESLVKLRSGKGNIDELENVIESFQKGALSKDSILAFIDQHQSVSTKADIVLTLKAKKVEYLGKDSTIEHILHRNSKGHVYILIDENVIDSNSSPVHSVFKDLYNLNENSSKFFVADPKVCTQIKSPSYPVIHHYVNGKLESDDYYNANKILFTSNLIKFDPQPRLKPEYDSSDKERLLLPCPQADCSSFCNWRCFRCHQDVEYGENMHFYCRCGESNIAHCKFKCSGPNHNEGYVSFELDTLIDILEPPEGVLNILLLGETGVGKSTFINAFVNYLKFNTLDDANSKDIEVLITSKFTLMDENYEMKTIKIGDDDSNEMLGNVGMSSTQGCKSYVFHTPDNKLIRLIDTPGIGDTRGLDQDKENFENIMKYISQYRHINGICILLKPNNARLTVVFRFCIQELLSHLHRNAKDNIVFCFTNARGTFYRPGDTLPPLKQQLEILKERSGVEIKINKDAIYCFDNESFRFLAAIKEGMNFTKADKQNFAESWKKSVFESKRLIRHIVTRTPHAVRDTLSLNSSRNIIVILSKPLAEIGQLIQTNIKLIKKQRNEIASSHKTIAELKDKLYIPQIDLEPVTLGYPRTVCTSSSCVRSVQIGQTGIKKIDYITQCHYHCYLNNVQCDEINNEALRRCKAMIPNGYCTNCSCHWSKHMHITYENQQLAKRIIDQNVELQISKKKSDQEKKNVIIDDYQKRVAQLQIEQETINKISIKFAQFIRQSAIAAFNDAYADYLDHFINEEKIKKSADPKHYDDEVLKGLEDTKRSYLEQIVIIKQAKDPSMNAISPKDIVDLEQKLYNLPINGQTLKKIKGEAKRSQTDAFKFKETHYLKTKNFVAKAFATLFT